MVRPTESSQSRTGRPRSKPRGRGKVSIGSFAVILAFIVLFGVVGVVWEPPIWLPVLYLAASLVCFLFYAADKAAARSGGWRVPESTLLLLGLVGGWPGALIAQQTLRHKTIKPSFRASFWVSVVVNIGVFLIVCSPDGISQLLEWVR